MQFDGARYPDGERADADPPGKQRKGRLPDRFRAASWMHRWRQHQVAPMRIRGPRCSRKKGATSPSIDPPNKGSGAPSAVNPYDASPTSAHNRAPVELAGFWASIDDVGGDVVTTERSFVVGAVSTFGEGSFPEAWAVKGASTRLGRSQAQ